MSAELIGGLLSRSALRDLVKKLEFLLSEAWRRELVSDGNFQTATGNGEFCWWVFYEIPFITSIGLLIHGLGMGDGLLDAAGGDNPARTQLEYLRLQADSDDFSAVPRDPNQIGRVVNLLFAVCYSMDTVAHFGVPMDKLLSRAANKDVEALRDAISIDRMAAATSIGSAIISTAQIHGDSASLEVIFSRPKPHAKRRVYRILRYGTQVLKELGALDRGMSRQIVDLLKSLGVGPEGGEDRDHLLRELVRKFQKEAIK